MAKPACLADPKAKSPQVAQVAVPLLPLLADRVVSLRCRIGRHRGIADSGEPSARAPRYSACRANAVPLQTGLPISETCASGPMLTEYSLPSRQPMFQLSTPDSLPP